MANVTASYNWVSGETVTPTKLNTTAAPTVVVADNEVTTAKIADANVTTAKIADGNVTAAKLASNSVETAKIADDAVTDAKLSLAANAGEIKKALNADNAPPIFACRAWVSFSGSKDTTGAASASNTNRLIRSSGNISSVSRNAAGDYTINFTTAMPDANYAAQVTAQGTTNTPALIGSFMGSNGSSAFVESPTASSMRIAIYNYNYTGVFDSDFVSVCIFR
jgi:hypothetical protein